MGADMIRIPFLPMLFLLFVGTLGPCAAATKAQSQSAARHYQIDKTPAWVTKIGGPTHPLPGSSATGAVQILLSDTQVNLLGPKPVAYFHEEIVAQERAGLESVSSIRVTFNPRFEALTMHELAVVRDGKRVDRLATARFDFAQRERRLEEGIYDEDLEAIIALTDVRIGDRVEYAYSIAGDNPVFSGKYSRFFALDREYPIGKLSVRIQHPVSRELRHKQLRSDRTVTEMTDGKVKTLSLTAETLPPVRLEEGAPSWSWAFPWFQVSEYASWEDVNAWARTLYSVPKDLSPEIEAVLDRIHSEAKDPQERVMKALEWVQNEIRYYSVSVGTSSHRPNPPNLTASQRFGDCKDKSVLLSAMLQRLGVKADPVLVSYLARRGLADALPTPRLFDHVIVRAELGDETYWLDGTGMYQGRDLRTLGFFPFHLALLAASPSRELTAVVPSTRPNNGSRVVETFEISKYGAPVTMTVKEQYLGNFAENLRRRIAAEGLRRILEHQHADYGRDFPNIALKGEAKLDDDQIANVMSLTQTYEIPRLFHYEAGMATVSSIHARSIVPWLRFPGTPDRSLPLELAYPASFDHAVVLDLPNTLPAPVPAPEHWQDRHLAVNNRVTLDGTRLSFSYGARTLKDHVTAADFPGFSEEFKRNGWSLFFGSLRAPLVDDARFRERLLRDFKDAGANFRKPDRVDELHLKFLRNYAIADESIRSGLLDGELLARAYRDRAEAASSLGRRLEALDDIARAISLDPSDAAYVLKAEIQLFAGDYRDALDSLNSVTNDADKTRTLMDAGQANFYLENYAEAQRFFARAADVATPDELPYSLYWLAMSAGRAGHDPASVLKTYRGLLPGAWPAEAIPFVLGELSPDDLIAAARRDERESRLRLCEAYFFLGQTGLLKGKVSDARRWFGKSLDTKVWMYREHTFARHELRRLGTD